MSRSPDCSPGGRPAQIDFSRRGRVTSRPGQATRSRLDPGPRGVIVYWVGGGTSFLGGAAEGDLVGVSAFAFGRLSAAAGSARFFGFGFSDGGRGAGREARSALRRAFLVFSWRLRLRLSSRSFSRILLSRMSPTLCAGGL